MLEPQLKFPPSILDRSLRCIFACLANKEVLNSLDRGFCLKVLKKVLTIFLPEIFTTDQGRQFTSLEFSGRLKAESIRLSLDSRGRFFDNTFIERLWRTVKDEEVYVPSYERVQEARKSLSAYFVFSNQERLPSAPGYKTPQEVYFGFSGEARAGGQLDLFNDLCRTIREVHFE